MSDPKFVHLHCHTHFSLLDGANHIKPLIERTKTLGMDALAMTDHGNMFGTIEFYTTARKVGIKPILGCEVYVAPGHRGDRSGKPGQTATHLVLLASSNVGYQNLIKLVSRGYLEGFYYNPRIDREILTEHNEGLIAICGHLGTDLASSLLNGDVEAAEASAKWYRDLFGPERFYVEIQRHGNPDQERVNPLLIDLADRVGLPLVATNDVHYLTRDDAFVQEVSICINTGKTLEDENPLKHETQELYLKSPEEMAELFGDRPDAIENTVRIAERCNVGLDLASRHAPVFKPPKGKTDNEYLRELVYEKAAEKYGEISDELRRRIDYELEVIGSKGFSSYFLIVWDFVKWARKRGIPCGARGSGCSAVIGYCLDLSAPDPIRYGLYFERFMDPDRDEMPDIDMDICQFGRADIINYVREKYGHVAQIITFGTLKAKAAIRDVCRVMGVDLAMADRMAKLVPDQLKMTIAKALEQEPELAKLCKQDERCKQVVEIAQKLEGMARHASVHAAGVVVADKPLTDFLPLYKPSDGENPITQFEGEGVEKVGLLKMDFLGLRTLTILKRACDLAERRAGRSIDLNKLDLTDQRVYELFAKGETKGVFQFESGGMRDVLLKMRPNRIEDLIAANALYRPGPMVNIDAYVARKHGEQWNTPHAAMTEVLNETYGIMVYQEQVSRLVNRLGDIELKRAFRLAKAISKKKTKMIEAEKQPFIDGAVANGVDAATADKIFDDILRFGGYAFNKSHSTGYALVAFQTAYMKTYWPVEFMAALLTYEIPAAKPEDRGLYIDECRRMGIPIRPPDINQSESDFTVVYEEDRASGESASSNAKSKRGQGYIRFGLAGIKGVGESAVHAIMQARDEGGPFKDLFDFCERVDGQKVNRGVMEALIKAGAFDSTGATRKALVDVLDGAIRLGADSQRDRRDGQMNMFESFEASEGPSVSRTIGS
ncbi:MAG: DNA polymerase III subunit alpha, partial [Phycisphaerae bacterium]|nr:DNA polymerase III subunit alpha [Phycisphaerae bacterium]